MKSDDPSVQVRSTPFADLPRVMYLVKKDGTVLHKKVHDAKQEAAAAAKGYTRTAPAPPLDPDADPPVAPAPAIDPNAPAAPATAAPAKTVK
jgi:hypothetical protein